MRLYYSLIAALLLSATPVFAEEAATVVNIHPAGLEGTKQGVKQFVGVSGKNAGAKGISMNKVVIPAGGSAEPHTHSDYESTIYLLKGKVRTYYGEGLKQSIVSEAGDFIYIPANMLHYPVNLSKTEEAIAIVARNDPDEQEHVVLYEGAKPE